jgi:tripartite-type tricarboxylate transporter receptor subunit TctC
MAPALRSHPSSQARRAMRLLLAPLACTLASVLAPCPAAAQQVPLPPIIRIVVPATPGASTDALARAVAAQLAARTGSNVIVENKAGASTMLGSAAVARGAKDGSILLINSTTLISTGATMKNPPLDVVNDLTPVALLEQNPLVIAVNANSAIRTPADLVAAARAAPDHLTHGTAGVGTIAHIGQELLQQHAGIKMKHVPYRGAAPAVVDLAGGVIDLVISTNSTLAPALQSGKARLIAVTSAEPSPAFPGLPTMASAAPGFAVDLWIGFFAPSGTPAPVIQRLNHEIVEIARSDKLREMFAADGGTPLPLNPEQIQLKVRETYATMKKLATDKNIVAE